MKYLVRVSELRYGSVEVEAESEEAAKTVASGVEIDYFDSEITDMEAEPVKEERTYIVTECCPHCEHEIEMRWNTEELGFEARCPVCGGRLMLCDECQHLDNPVTCDWNRHSDSCRMMNSLRKNLWMRLGVSIPLTRSEMVLVKNGGTESAELIKAKVSEGAFELDGESYAPATEGSSKNWSVNEDLDFNF